ncbi:MAG: glycosyltransferase [Prevotellaceae bacterium]|jgi:hypothetical protein|nr:glycosyltransferase [Prevotellaceae bacterium]
MNNQYLAPICLFVYNRLELTKQTVESLKKNFLANESELFIFSDGAKSKNATEKVEQVREYVKTIEGFKTITILESEINKGLAKSIIDGVTEIINKYGKTIVIEDDLYLSPSFLAYMNQMLDNYCSCQDVFQISGFGLKVRKPADYHYDVFFHNRPNSWGWATWCDRWNSVDWEVKNWVRLKEDKRKQKAFNRGGTDLFKMLKGYMEGKNNSWYVRFAYAQFAQHKYAIAPIKSFVLNRGFIKDSTHCDAYNRYKTDFQDSKFVQIQFPQQLFIERRLINQAFRYYSLSARFIAKIRTFFTKIFR